MILHLICSPTLQQVTPSNKSKKKVTEKTPLLDSTNQSAKSSLSTNKSLRSTMGKTPMSLRKVMTRAFRKSKYDVKTGSRTGLGGTPKKKLKL